ncbi:MAG: hypothetical protein GY711_17005 [bacterium]|nr:hypothetical protein [bacterium]
MSARLGCLGLAGLLAWTSCSDEETPAPAPASSELGVRYCSPNAKNSTGRSALLTATGEADSAAESLELTADFLPKGEWAIFVWSTESASYESPGTFGLSCVHPETQRLPFGGSGAVSTGGGSARFTVDLTQDFSIPVLPGDSWYFQCWYQDSGMQGFSDALEIAFR